MDTRNGLEELRATIERLPVSVSIGERSCMVVDRVGQSGDNFLYIIRTYLLGGNGWFQFETDGPYQLEAVVSYMAGVIVSGFDNQ